MGLRLVGRRAEMTVTVTEEMTAAFDDEHVHDVYGTAALVKHAEQVSRRLLRPHLQPGTEGVGAQIALRQVAPVAVGATVTVSATVTDAAPRRMVTAVTASVGAELVAEGEFVQAVVDVAAWRASART